MNSENTLREIQARPGVRHIMEMVKRIEKAQRTVMFHKAIKSAQDDALSDGIELTPSHLKHMASSLSKAHEWLMKRGHSNGIQTVVFFGEKVPFELVIYDLETSSRHSF